MISGHPGNLSAISDGGQSVQIAATPEGHLEVAIHSPINPFGSIHAEGLTPVFQVDAVYGINTTEVSTTTGLGYDPGPSPGSFSSTVTGTNNLFKCSTGTTAYSFASLQSRKRLRYRPGQGVVNRFTALWSSPVASSTVVAGCGTSESGYYFGYNGTSFGILHVTGGVREIQTLTISAAATTGGTVVLRLNGIDTTITIPTSTTTTRTAYDISQQTVPGWTMVHRGSTVIFVASSAGNKANGSTLTRGTALVVAGTFATTVEGVASTDTWIPQASWNGDTCDGAGASGFTLDPTKGNVFQIGITYLGFGPVTFSVMIPNSEGNNATWTTVHTINHPNSRTSVSTTQPSFPFTMAAYSAGSTTDVWVASGSFAGFVEGQRRNTGPRMTYDSFRNNYVSTGNYYPLFTVRNDIEFNGRPNQVVINLLSCAVAHGDATPVNFYLIRNATLNGPVNYTQHSTKSATYVDIGATTCSLTTNDQLVFSLPTGNGGNAILAFTDDVTLQPGETITLAARAATGTVVWAIGNLNTREDQ